MIQHVAVMVTQPLEKNDCISGSLFVVYKRGRGCCSLFFIAKAAQLRPSCILSRATFMKRLLLSILWVIFSTVASAQQIAANQLTQLVANGLTEAERLLAKSSYNLVLSQMSNDTLYKTFEFRAKNRKWQTDSVSRKIVFAVCQQYFDATYYTTVPQEYNQIKAALKKQGYYCDYDKEESVASTPFLYQKEDRTVQCFATPNEEGSTYCIKLHRQNMPTADELKAADDLLKFTSHEYLVYYFGEKNVRKDMFYFAANDVVKCSVLFMNTERQVIFVWKDAKNSREISNLIFGGPGKLKSQASMATTVALQNQWRLKSGLRTGMHLVELCHLNNKGIVFCGGNAPNPGLILPESSGDLDFANADVVLSCVNCTDEKFMSSQLMKSDTELNEGRILFVQSIVLYPPKPGRENGTKN